MAVDLAIISVAVLITFLLMKRDRDRADFERHTITPEALYELLRSKRDVLLFDVRQPLDLLGDSVIIPGSKRLSPRDVRENPSLLPKDRDVVVYCTCPSDKTSRTVLHRALNLGFLRIALLKGGLDGWRARGYPVEPYEKPFHLDSDKSGHLVNPAPGSVLRLFLFCLLFLPGIRVYADVTLLIESPINFLGHVSSTGHAALLVDDLCSDDHLHMRWCRTGEDGAVISRYKGIGGHDWLAMPPGPYFFAVDSADEIPSSASTAEVERLRAAYRTNHPGSFEQDPPKDDWIQLLGASYRRRIICVQLHTTIAQDKRLMQWLNSRPNKTHFNFFFSNCADFARQMLDILFPRAVQRNFVFDFGMTTPKQLESSLHHYTLRHPELGYGVHELPQVSGNIPRSGRLYGVTESFVKSKPYLLPVAVLDPIGIGSVVALGLADHRYTPKATPRAPDYFFFHSQKVVAVATGSH
jgi:rhodanese-related sulfurtransferase